MQQDSKESEPLTRSADQNQYGAMSAVPETVIESPDEDEQQHEQPGRGGGEGGGKDQPKKSPKHLYPDADADEDSSSPVPKRSRRMSRSSVPHPPRRHGHGQSLHHANTTHRPGLPSSISGTQLHTSYKWLSNTGSEPGVDVTQDPGKYAALTDSVTVTVVDYANDGSGTRVDIPGHKFGRWLDSSDGQRAVIPDPDAMKNQQFMSLAQGSRRAEKDLKRAIKEGRTPLRSVRWINVDGMNWEMIKLLALKYDLHPLAIEDALRADNSPRSKADFYAEHLYTQVGPVIKCLHLIEPHKSYFP